MHLNLLNYFVHQFHLLSSYGCLESSSSFGSVVTLSAAVLVINPLYKFFVPRVSIPLFRVVLRLRLAASSRDHLACWFKGATLHVSFASLLIGVSIFMSCFDLLIYVMRG